MIQDALLCISALKASLPGRSCQHSARIAIARLSINDMAPDTP
ncbi:Hypothetical protein ETEE_0257 [Edwardsiella anguillarum ET080813]|uniref:Uncharacterized protein n=1 Tax=Edwardsiella anguillarum ET080813 TaxID=667120 RepID=A0A076LIM7_9GAMM|nr:Hypothetical protein ETEE_0257 [Edwardsiella anguillarum ET080813]